MLGKESYGKAKKAIKDKINKDVRAACKPDAPKIKTMGAMEQFWTDVLEDADEHTKELINKAKADQKASMDKVVKKGNTQAKVDAIEKKKDGAAAPVDDDAKPADAPVDKGNTKALKAKFEKGEAEKADDDKPKPAAAADMAKKLGIPAGAAKAKAKALAEAADDKAGKPVFEAAMEAPQCDYDALCAVVEAAKGNWQKCLKKCPASCRATCVLASKKFGDATADVAGKVTKACAKPTPEAKADDFKALIAAWNNKKGGTKEAIALGDKVLGGGGKKASFKALRGEIKLPNCDRNNPAVKAFIPCCPNPCNCKANDKIGHYIYCPGANPNGCLAADAVSLSGKCPGTL